MAWLTGIDHGGLLHGGRNLIYFILASSALVGIAHTSPLPELSYNITGGDTPDSPLLQTLWSFECYSASKACRGTGDTSAGSHSKQGCTSITAAGCTRYTYNGGGEFKLCLFRAANCGGNLLTSVNGGRVTCIDESSPQSYKIVPYASAC